VDLRYDVDGATVLFTTREGGVSEGPYASLNLGRMTGDDADRVEANRARLAERVGVPWGRVARARQVHGIRVLRDVEIDGDWPEGDAHVVTEHGRPALVFVADCLPIALVADEGVAMVHGGWRGLSDGIVAAAVRELGGARSAVIGPGIGACCYEVGDDVREAFPAETHAGRHLDLKRAAALALREAGVAEIQDAGLCTSCRADLFFSHRRDEGVTGRQAGVVWR
jgi:YfiH family protein